MRAHGIRIQDSPALAQEFHDDFDEQANCLVWISVQVGLASRIAITRVSEIDGAMKAPVPDAVDQKSVGVHLLEQAL